MKFSLAAIALCLCAFAGIAQKKADVDVVSMKVKRDGDRVVVDGRLRITTQKPIGGVVLVLDFMMPGNVVMVSKKVALDEDYLEPGDESEIHAETECPAKAVAYKVRAMKDGVTVLNVSNAGPYPILD